jgi:hypothetical protein
MIFISYAFIGITTSLALFVESINLIIEWKAAFVYTSKPFILKKTNKAGQIENKIANSHY